MTHIPLTLCLLALAGCAVFEPIEMEQRVYPVVLRTEDGTPVPAAYVFPERVSEVCGEHRACAVYHAWDDGTMDYRQRCNMYFNANDFTPEELSLLGRVSGCDSDNYIACHEETHCTDGDTHPRTRRQGLGKIGIQ